MTSWYAQALREAERCREEQARPKPRAIWRVPKDAPCNNCVQEVGSSLCKRNCDYWQTLKALASEGKLEEARQD